MSISLYDKSLREEFKLIRKLDSHQDTSKYIKIYFVDRVTGQKKSVKEEPQNNEKFPEEYEVIYTMPVYTRRGKKKSSWKGIYSFKLNERNLFDKNGSHKPNAKFDPHKVNLFNNHISGSRICDGTAWKVSRAYGLWYFIIAIGMLINQEPFISADGYHFNGDAYDYWVSRGKKPITVINWPFDLNSKDAMTIVSIKPVQKSPFIIKTVKKQKLTISKL